MPVSQLVSCLELEEAETVCSSRPLALLSCSRQGGGGAGASRGCMGDEFFKGLGELFVRRAGNISVETCIGVY